MGKSIESGHRKKFINLVLRVMMTVIYIYIRNFMRFSHHHQKNHSHPAYVTQILTTTDHSPSQDYTRPDDQTTLLHKF